jgi:hypothetical protein
MDVRPAGLKVRSVNPRIVAIGLGVAALAAGCGSSSSVGAASPPPTAIATTPAPTPSVTLTTTPTATPTPTPTVTVTAPVAGAGCTSGQLKLSLGVAQGTAGTTYQTIVFTNTGSTACTLFGYPGVSYVDAKGAIIGKPSSRDPGKKKTITLAPNGQANALLRQPDPGVFAPSSCHMTTADRLQVYPPDQTVALFVHDNAQVCTTGAGRSGIGPILAGDGG